MPAPSGSKRRRRAPPSRVHALGDAAAVLQLGNRIDTALNARALAIAAALTRRRGVREAVSGYASVTIHYDPDIIAFKALQETVSRLLKAKIRAAAASRLHRIPVTYDGPDLEETAGALRLEVQELVRRHTEPIYRVFMIGFVPGWAYLGPLPQELRLPRRKVPRTTVPAGSVAIAGAQTGIYPLPTPGGWHLLGRTSVPMFLPDADPPLLLRPGDRVKFFAQ